MGCFFACFRIKAGQRSPLSSLETTPCKTRDRAMARNRLASLLLSEEEDSPCEGDIGRDSADRELKHEAKFLKACGALLETPAKIRKGPEKKKIQTHEEDEQPDTSCKKLQWGEQPDQISNSPTSTPYDCSSEDCLPDNRYGNCTSVAEQTVTTCINAAHSDMFEPQCTVAQNGNESLCLNVIEDGSGHESRLDPTFKDLSPPQSGRQIHLLVSKGSPYPTPLKLTDGMETPGTLYPASLENCGYALNNRIRPQYAFSVQNSLVNLSQQKGMSEGLLHPGQPHELFQQQVQWANRSASGLELQHSLSSIAVDSGFFQSHNAPLTYSHLNGEVFSVDTVSRKAGSKPIIDCLDDPQFGSIRQTDLRPGNTTPMVSSLSQWLKPRNPDEKRVKNEIALKERSPASNSPERERPIIGMVATHWNYEETTRVSPKLWDGNGIPNSTNKYKEDQRVSWHATPFEERLEKALSDEKLFPQRKLLNGKPIEFDEEDEVKDTATS